METAMAGTNRMDVLREFFGIDKSTMIAFNRELLDLKRAGDADGVDHVGQLYTGIADGTLTYA